LREGDDAALGGGIDRLARTADAAGIARNVDDLALLRGDHRRQDGAAQPDGAEQVYRDQLVPHLRRVFHEGLDAVPAGTVDKAINALGALVHRRGEDLDRDRVGQIEG